MPSPVSTKRFKNEFVQLEGISTNILTDRLNRLLEHGIITRKIADNNRSSYLYSLTSKGLDLIPMIIEIYKWGANHTAGNNAEEQLKKQVNKDSKTVAEDFAQALKESHDID